MRSLTGQLGTALSALGNVAPGLAPAAALKAKKCFFPKSGWVHAFILTCDGHLAVWFKKGQHYPGPGRLRQAVGGVPDSWVVLYPTTDEAVYDLAIGWGDAGQFVRKFLYGLAYQKWAPPAAPCGTDCLPGVPCCGGIGLPYVLYATLTAKTGTCGCLPDSVVLNWNPAGEWNGSAPGCGDGALDFTLACTGGLLWNLSSNALTQTQNADAGGSCSPFLQAFSGFSPGSACSGSAKVTVTA